MRAIAISLVVFGHGWHFFPANDFTLFAKHFWVFGVEIFFVLSGFLIGGILIKSLENECTLQVIKIFWIRRWFRTLPNYYLFLFINVVGFGMFSDSFNWNYQYLFFLQNLAWMPERFFSVSWSLAVEEWFYLIIPPFVYLSYLAKNSIKNSILITALSIIFFVVLLRIYCAITLEYKWNEELRMVVILRLDTLMYGVLLAYIAHYHQHLIKQIVKPATLIGFILLTISFITKLNGYQETHPIVAALMFPLTAISFACFIPILSSWKKCSFNSLSKFITSISLWSYSLYLVHVPLLELSHLFVSKFINIYQTPLNIIVYICWLSLSVALSALIYRYWEQPTIKLREHFDTKP